ncbi:MAG: hypothetical protein ACJA16_000922 [Akkermansiaceae bacterium]|jgi:hypothetical protein
MEKEPIVKYLEAWGELDRYYVFVSENVRPGLIYSIDKDGESSALMDDDDERVNLCIQFLRDRGNPVFVNSQEEEAYLTKFQE